MLWTFEQSGTGTVAMSGLSVETRRVADELVAREADARRTLVFFALALALAVGTVLGILGAGSLGMIEAQSAEFVGNRLQGLGTDLAILAGSCGFTALAIVAGSFIATRQRAA